MYEQICRQPCNVILFYEIEKVQPNIFNVFLQLLDEDYLTNNRARPLKQTVERCILKHSSIQQVHIRFKNGTIAILVILKESL